MDPRGLGYFDGQKISKIENAIWAMDAAEAGKEGRVRLQFQYITFPINLVS